jgi:adenine/guanine phosphoribosyltransferase-like PRPP-binding protein
MAAPETNADSSRRTGSASESGAVEVALSALIWTLGDQSRATRLLDLTGLDPAELRERAGEPALLAATIGFLEAYEPDLIACAESLGMAPSALVAARIALEK